VIQVVAEAAKVPVESIHIVIREGRGLHYTFGGEPVP
jgi:phenylpyruvate tautomerase PptA (4-oxalocrotonate tautomerase family)